MSDYIRVYNLTIKDSLPTGNSNKVIKGTELDVELNAVAAAIASKADSNDPTFTGTPVAPTATFGTDTTQLATTAFVQAALQAIYPVGSVYINATVATNPSTLLGFGTWVTVGDGKVLVNQDTSDTDFDVLGETGGSKSSVSSHTHTFTSGTESVGHTHSGTTSAVSNDHTHSYSGNTGGHSADHSHSGTTAGAGSHSHTMLSVVGGGNNFANSGPYTGGTGTTSTVGDHAHNFSTGGVSANHTHAFSGTTSGISANHTHTITTGGVSASHTHSGTTASTGTSNGNLVPYVTVRMWKRTG
jgi:hypothetical protein